MSDEQRWDTLGCNGNSAARTPRLDALAESSTVFDGCYTPFPLCCPSRTSLWTGQMPRHHHVLGNWQAIDPALVDSGVGRAFRDAGYHTVYTGKWHVPGTTPQRMGFVDSAAVPATIEGRDRGRYIEAYRAYALEQGYDLVDGHIENLTKADLASLKDPAKPHRGTAQINLEHYLETWQTGEFLGALDRRPADSPWFAVCSFNAPHFPMIVPRPYNSIIDRDQISLPTSFLSGPDTRPREVRTSGFATRYADLDPAGWIDLIGHYLGFCALIDTQVGRILDHLSTVGELDRTIVLVTSDHGDMMGAHRLMEKGHLLHYEETLRLPLLLRHPDCGAARTSNLVSVVDIPATLAELAGVPWHPGDGKPFAHMLGQADASPTRDYVTAETVRYGSGADPHGEHIDPHGWDALRDAINLSIRTSQVRYTYRSEDVAELYDHQIDPAEQHNRAADPAYEETVQRLRATLAAEVRDVYPQVARDLAAC